MSHEKEINPGLEAATHVYCKRTKQPCRFDDMQAAIDAYLDAMGYEIIPESQSLEIEGLGRLVDWYQEQYVELVAEVERLSLPHDVEQHQFEGETASDSSQQKDD